MNETDMTALADWIVMALKSPSDDAAIDRIRYEVKNLCVRYPVPGAS